MLDRGAFPLGGDRLSGLRMTVLEALPRLPLDCRPVPHPGCCANKTRWCE
jgi:hypothetical protein